MHLVLLLLACAVLWGSTPIIDKIALAKTDPEVGIIIRSIAICITALLFMIVSGKTQAVLNTDAKATLLFSASGLMAGLGAMFFYFMALKLGPASK
ncbi:MAG: EamA family transporter, partial [Planctomycetes bacterium]|nr:EamA family transporter [Planctomycetota bacterium]